MHLHCRLYLALLSLAALVSACSDATSDANPDGPQDVTVRTADFAFTAPDTVSAGLTRIRLFNDGPEDHQVLLVRLEAGLTFPQLLDSVAAGKPTPSGVTPIGGPNPPAPGAPSEVTLNLTAGQYAMLCLIPSPDGTPHFIKGMVRSLVVVPGAVGDRPEPATDATIVLKDFEFTLTPRLRPKVRLTSGLRAGRQTIRVENAGTQPHELVFFRLDPGKKLADLVSFLEQPAGAPPGVPNGGTVDLAPGLVNFVTADFPAGNYVIICLVPEATDGRPHFAHGMIKEITVE